MPDTLLPDRTLPPFMLLGTAGTGLDGEGGGRANGSLPFEFVRVGVMGLKPPDLCPLTTSPPRLSLGTSGTSTSPWVEGTFAPSDIDRLAPLLLGLASGWENISTAALRLCWGGERCDMARLRGGVVFCRLSLLLLAFDLVPLPIEELERFETGESGGDAGSASVA